MAMLLTACGGGGGATSLPPPEPPTTTLGQPIGTVEIDIIGLGSAKPGSVVRWDGEAPQRRALAVPTASGTAAATPEATAAAAANLPRGLDIQFQSASSIDTGSRPGGTRYISVTYQVRNAQFSSTPGSGTAYDVARKNLTFLAVVPSTGINYSAITRFVKFDNSAADPALALQLIPTHGMNSTATAVEAARASMQVYREAELPPVDASVSDVLPYGFVVHNVNDGTRTLPASPAAGQFDGLVTFAFKLPLQANANDDPFKITVRFQVMEDSNTRVTQSLEDTDASVAARAAALGSTDIALPCHRVSALPSGNPICRVRLAGPAASPTAYLSTAQPAEAARVISSPSGLPSQGRRADIVLATSQEMLPPTAATLVVHGAQSGRRTLAGAYAGVLEGGGGSGRPNQLVFRLRPEDKPFFPGETVMFTATAGNSSAAGTPLTAFVGSHRVQGTVPAAAAGSFGAVESLASATGVAAGSVAAGDLNGDGRLDLVVQIAAGVSVALANAAGGYEAAVNYAVGTNPAGLALGDMNGDGRLDVVVLSLLGSSRGISILTGLGDGTLSAAVSTALIPSSAQIRALSLADFNGDGRLDVAYTTFVAAIQGRVLVAFGQADGSLTAPVEAAVNVTAIAMSPADFNADGKLDLAVITTSTVLILLGNGEGTFQAQGSASVTGLRQLAVGDLNGDGRPDLVTVAGAASGTLTVSLGDGAGGFSTAGTYAVGGPASALVLADVSGDGALDIVLTTGSTASNSAVQVLLSTGGGAFAAATSALNGVAATGLAVADADGDGRLDLLLSTGSALFRRLAQ